MIKREVTTRNFAAIFVAAMAATLCAAVPDGADHIFAFNGALTDSGSAQTFTWDGGYTSVSYTDENTALVFGSDANSTPYGHGLTWPSSGTDKTWTIACRAKLPSAVVNSGNSSPMLWAIGSSVNTTTGDSTSVNQSYVFALCGNADGTGVSLRNGWTWPENTLVSAELSDGANVYHTYVVRISSPSGQVMQDKECKFELFIDGVSCGTATKYFNPKQGCLRIGEYYGHSPWYQANDSGALDELRTYSRALSYKEIIDYATSFESGTAVECNVATDNSEIYDGTFDSSVATVTKTGAGTLTLLGLDVFAGTLNVNAGTLKMGSYTNITELIHDYDASRTDSFTYDESDNTLVASLANVAGSVAKEAKATAVKPYVTTAYLNGRQGLYSSEPTFTPQYALVASNTFVVAQEIDPVSEHQWSRLMNRSGQNEWNNAIQANDTRWDQKLDGSKYRGTGYLRMNGSTDSFARTTEPFLMSVVSRWQTLANSYQWVEYFNDQPYAVGEMIAYGKTLSATELDIVEKGLMYKWGISDESYSVLASGAEVSVANGATLDVGLSIPAVRSLTIACGATVAVDSAVKGTVLATATDSMSVGKATLVINGVASETLAPRAVHNSDGTWSLVAGNKANSFILIIR